MEGRSSLLLSLARDLKGAIGWVRRINAHPRTPWRARLWIGLGLLYLASPIDLIPDFIPIIGYLDDAVIVPLLIGWGIKAIPEEVIAECAPD